MTPELWRRVQDVFARALEVEDVDDRATLLDAECGSDTVLRREVDSLLEAHEMTGGFTNRDSVRDPTAGDLREGDVVDGKYRVEAPLGKGGMGAVYRATHVGLERTVALKVIRAERIGEPAAAERFRREAVAVARLRHPNIVTVYDYGVAPGAGAYLVMEYLQGRSLRETLAACRPLEPHDALDLFGHVCAAIAAAHAAGIVHRDVKPENIYLEAGAHGTVVKVLDFGLAQFVEGAPSLRIALTLGGVALGTPAYMSPEQCQGEEADARSDVYALGCVLYEMLAGRPPFVRANMTALLYSHVHEPPASLADLVPGLPPEIGDAVARALAKAPDERFETADAFASALGQSSSFAGHETVSPGGATVAKIGALTDAQRALEAEVPAATPTNLPTPVTRFVGREREVAAVLDAVAASRLVTLVGPGGIGKTRLAIEAASHVLDEFPDGVWIVELAALADPALVAQATVVALDLRDNHASAMADRLKLDLAEKRTLLVLDNCEHLVEPCAHLVEELLVNAPKLRVLATSREAFGINGETVWLVPALAISTSDGGAGESESARLFADRAALARSDFDASGESSELVATLCRRLEGSPLAIELAAARVRVLSLDQILERLDDRLRLLAGGQRTAPARQRAMRATLDWSWELLTEAERLLLWRLPVFAGGWTLAAAEAVCADPVDATSAQPDAALPPFDVLDVLARLVDKSLVVVDRRETETRYRMLETVRAYAAERLDEAGGEPEVHDRRDRWFLAHAERAEPELWSPQADSWLGRLDVEHDNFRAILRRATTEETGDVGIRMCAALGRFWFRRGYWSEGLESIEAALARDDGAAVVARGRVVNTRATLLMFRADFDGALASYEEAVATQRASGDRAGLCRTLYSYASACSIRADYGRATVLAEECVAIAREIGDRRTEVLGRSSLGYLAIRSGDPTRAREILDGALELAREQGRTFELCLILFNLGQATIDLGDPDRAVALLAEAGEIAEEMGDRTMVPGSRAARGMAELDRRDPKLAVSLFRESLVAFVELNTLYDVASMFEALANAAVALDDPRRALHLAGAGSVLRERIDVAMSAAERKVHEPYMTRARAALPEREAARAFDAGREMTFEQAVAYALED